MAPDFWARGPGRRIICSAGERVRPASWERAPRSPVPRPAHRWLWTHSQPSASPRGRPLAERSFSSNSHKTLSMPSLSPFRRETGQLFEARPISPYAGAWDPEHCYHWLGGCYRTLIRYRGSRYFCLSGPIFGRGEQGPCRDKPRCWGRSRGAFSPQRPSWATWDHGNVWPRRAVPWRFPQGLKERSMVRKQMDFCLAHYCQS